MELNADQKAAVEGILNAQAFILTGGPGTGKTTTLKAASEALRADGQRALFCAPTGKAALRMQSVIGMPATTIHRALFGPGTEERFHKHSVLVVDEGSMVDSELMGALSRRVVKSGIRLVLVGDPNQLTPVGPGKPFEDAVASGVVPAVHLQRVYRQHKESWVLDNAYKVLDGEMVDLENKEDFTFIETDDTTASALDYLGLQWEAGCPPQEFQIITPQRIDSKTRDTGATTERINQVVHDSTEPDAPGVYEMEWGKKFRTGDRVIQTSNNYQAGVMNGQQGIVVFANNGGVRVKFDENFGGDAEDGVWYSDCPGNARVPDPTELELAYAITVHKSQGSAWPRVAFVADDRHGKMLQRRLFYTAITRVERHLTIIGTRTAVSRAVRSESVNDRNTLLLEKLKGNLPFRGSQDIPRI